MTENEELFIRRAIDLEALKEGHFCFTEKYHTRYLIDVNIILQYPKQVKEYGKQMYEKFFEKSEVNHIITPNFRSGNLLANNVAERLKAEVTILERRKGKILSKKMSIKEPVIIIDDSINTGNSLKQVFEILVSQGIEVEGVGVLLNRYTDDLERDFEYKVKSLFDFRKKYEIINVEENECQYCKQYEIYQQEYENEKNPEEKELLEKGMRDLELKSAYSNSRM